MLTTNLKASSSDLLMATSTPATPVSQANAPTPRTDSPGAWRHPRFNEILKRRNATVFSERHLKRAIWNGGCLLIVLLFRENLGTLYVSFLLSRNDF